MSLDQRRSIADIEERAQTIRRQAEAVLRMAEGTELGKDVRPVLEGVITNTSHLLNSLDLLRATIEI